MESGINIKKIKNLSKYKKEQILHLYKEALWWDEEDEKDSFKINRIIKGSFLFVVAIFENKIIGMARVISDGASDAYIQDVFVDKNFRKMGVGSRLIYFILDYLKKKKISWIGLISTPESKDFYTKLGFESLKGFNPMIYKGTK